MKRTLWIAVAACCVWCWGVATAETTAGDGLWRLVAKSRHIVAGTLNTPVEEIQTALAAGKGEYVPLKLSEPEFLKGAVPEQPLEVRYYTEDAKWRPSSSDVIALNTKRVILFLCQVDRSFYFIHEKDACMPYSADLAARIRGEIAEQQKIVSEYPKWAHPVDKKIDKTVENLIKGLLKSPEQAQESANELARLDRDAIPALIKRLDDSRPIKARQIGYYTSGGFEGIAHYSPDVVTDVLATILPGIAHESFGQIQSGGSDQDRREVVDAWRVYLHRLENSSPEPLPTP